MRHINMHGQTNWLSRKGPLPLRRVEERRTVIDNVDSATRIEFMNSGALSGDGICQGGI